MLPSTARNHFITASVVNIMIVRILQT